MFLIYIFKEGSWEFWESVRYIEFFGVIENVVNDINCYLGLYDEDVKLNLNYNKFLYDMIHYKQYVSDHIVIYYLDMPGGLNG